MQRVIEAHRQQGLKISYNQALIVLIHRGATPDPDTKEEAWRKIEQHWTTCPDGCSYDKVSCPEGWRLHDVLHRTPGTIPPSAHRRPPATPEPRTEAAPAPAWRRLLAVGRAG